MNTPPNSSAPARLHPLLVLAALAILLFSLVGTAAILGWIPSSVGGAGARQPSEAERAALASPLPPAPLQAAPGVAATVPGQQFAQGDAEGGAALAAAASHQEAVPKPNKKTVPVAADDTGRNWCANCGNVESVQAIKQRAQGSGVGAAGGAVIGGLLGNQIGGGTGRTLATAAGAIGGAVVGNQVEGNMKATTSYEIRVRLDDGTLRTFRQNSQPAWHSGDRVRIVKGRLRSAS